MTPQTFQIMFEKFHRLCVRIRTPATLNHFSRLTRYKFEWKYFRYELIIPIGKWRQDIYLSHRRLYAVISFRVVHAAHTQKYSFIVSAHKMRTEKYRENHVKEEKRCINLLQRSVNDALETKRIKSHASHSVALQTHLRSSAVQFIYLFSSI